MYSQEEFTTHYAEVTGNSQHPVQQQGSDFKSYFKKMFAEIDELMLSEVADVQSR